MALAFEYAKQGSNLILMARRGQLLEDLKTTISNLCPNVKIITKISDVSNYEEHMKDVRICAEEAGSIDVAIANAGIGFKTNGVQNSFNEARETYEVNLIGAVATLEAAKDVMIKQGSGKLVGISSVAATRGLPNSNSYCASKAGLTTHLEGLAVDLKNQPVSVTIVHPGFVTTPMTEKNGKMPWLMDADKAAQLIYHAVKKGKRRLFFPWQMKILCWVMRIMPNCIFDFLAGIGLKRAEEFHKERINN